VILRWLIQRKVVVLAKSTHLSRIQENFGVFDFALSNSDMARIKALDMGKTLFTDHRTVAAVERMLGSTKLIRSAE
jgi:diketogulonate reductase-like aldo/keto reductase